jgi:hypothetical protein
MPLTLLSYGLLLKLLGVLALSKEVVLGIDLRNKREPDEALVNATRSTGLSRSNYILSLFIITPGS